MWNGSCHDNKTGEGWIHLKTNYSICGCLHKWLNRKHYRNGRKKVYQFCNQNLCQYKSNILFHIINALFQIKPFIHLYMYINMYFLVIWHLLVQTMSFQPFSLEVVISVSTCTFFFVQLASESLSTWVWALYLGQ